MGLHFSYWYQPGADAMTYVNDHQTNNKQQTKTTTYPLEHSVEHLELDLEAAAAYISYIGHRG